MNIIVTDENTGTEEVNTIYEITKNAGYTPTTILLPGKMETGVKKSRLYSQMKAAVLSATIRLLVWKNTRRTSPW